LQNRSRWIILVVKIAGGAQFSECWRMITKLLAITGLVLATSGAVAAEQPAPVDNPPNPVWGGIGVHPDDFGGNMKAIPYDPAWGGIGMHPDDFKGNQSPIQPAAQPSSK
jgi:hypothetical protein